MKVTARDGRTVTLRDDGIYNQSGALIHKIPNGANLVISDEDIKVNGVIVPLINASAPVARNMITGSISAHSIRVGDVVVAGDNEPKEAKRTDSSAHDVSKRRRIAPPKQPAPKTPEVVVEATEKEKAPVSVLSLSSSEDEVPVAVEAPEEKKSRVFSLLTLDWDGTACTSSSELLCTVCMKNKRDVLLRPCGHVPFCIECACTAAAEYVESGAATPCPQCKTNITIAHRVYL